MIEIQKELNEIALDITEPQYRAMPELSYSNLSTYERTGYNGLEHLFDKIESPSLTLGSIVDTILTGGKDEFDDKFTVLDVNVTDGGKKVIDKLLSMNLPYDSFEDIPQGIVSNAAKEAGFWKDDKWNNRRYHEVLNTGNIAALYNASLHAEKTIVDTETYNDAVSMVKALREAPATSGYFADNDELSPIKRYYQLKFKAKLQGVGYRCMAD